MPTRTPSEFKAVLLWALLFAIGALLAGFLFAYADDHPHAQSLKRFLDNQSKCGAKQPVCIDHPLPAHPA